MMARTRFVLVLLAIFAKCCGAEEVDAPEATTEIRNKTLSELVQEQTDAIRKIIADQKPQIPLAKPEIPLAKPEIKDAAAEKAQKEREFIEELKYKCQNFFKLFPTSTTTEKTEKTVQPFGPPIKPDFLKPKPDKYHYISLFQYRPNKMGDNLDTAESSLVEESVDTTTVPAPTEPDKLKYVRLEPLVLQKTLLTNGKTLFYWYRSVPAVQSFVQIPDTPDNVDVDTVAQPQHTPHNVPIPERYHFYIDPYTGAILPNHAKPTKPQFYINPQNGMIYQSAQHFIQHQTSSSTTELPQPPPGYTVDYTDLNKPAPIDLNKPAPIDDKYKHELKFVVPLLVTPQPPVAKYPYAIDPNAYLPKDQRPPLMNIAVPYLPNYHMIQSLAIPKKYQESTTAKVTT